jgi:hypothetical protein
MLASQFVEKPITLPRGFRPRKGVEIRRLYELWSSPLDVEESRMRVGPNDEKGNEGAEDFHSAQEAIDFALSPDAEEKLNYLAILDVAYVHGRYDDRAYYKLVSTTRIARARKNELANSSAEQLHSVIATARCGCGRLMRAGVQRCKHCSAVPTNRCG